MRFLAACALTLVLCLLVGGAYAQGADTATADRLFREGRALMKAGKYEQACSKLEESHRIDPAPGTAINLGDCFEKVGKVASALLAYQAARKLLQANDPRLAPVRQQISILEKRVPRLLIRLARGSPPETNVTRDGRRVEPDTRVAVNPGKHVIVITVSGRETTRRTLTLAEGQSRELLVEPGDAAPETEVSSQRRAPSRSPARGGNARDDVQSAGSSQDTWGYAIGVIGLASLAGASYFEMTLAAECDNFKCADDPRDKQTTAQALWIIGAAGVGVGAYLVLTHDASAPAPQSAIGPTLLPGGAAVTLKTVF